MNRCPVCGSSGLHVCDSPTVSTAKAPWPEMFRVRNKQFLEEVGQAMGRQMGYLAVAAVRHGLDEERLRQINDIISHGDWMERILLYLLVTNPEIGLVALGYQDPPPKEK